MESCELVFYFSEIPFSVSLAANVFGLADVGGFEIQMFKLSKNVK
jgi:hypothetical protein